MESLAKELKENWELIAAIIAGFWILWSYTNTQKKNLSWNRTSLLFEQANLFETDPDIKLAVLILEGRHEKFKIDDLFDSDGEPQNSERGEVVQSIDRMLNLLQRIGYATIALKTLNQSESELLGWYYSKILSSSRLTKYCEKYGYDCVVEFAKKI